MTILASRTRRANRTGTIANAARLTKAAGFTYVGLLIVVAIMGVGLAAVGTVWRTQAQREREQDLLFIGHDFERAIASYYRAGRQFPAEIDDLLEDKRGPLPVHHLRRFYNDPMTGARDWSIIRDGTAGIIGIASTSKDVPIKKDGFSNDEDPFKDAANYGDWQFVYKPRLRFRRPAGAVPAAAD